MKKFLAVLLSFVLIFTSVITVFAEAGEEPEFYTLNLDKLYEEGALPEGVTFTYDAGIDLNRIPANTYVSLKFKVPKQYNTARLFLKVSPNPEFVDYDYTILRSSADGTFLIYMNSDKSLAYDLFEIKSFYIDVIVMEEYAIRQCEPYDENDPTPFEVIPGGRVVQYGGDYWFKLILAPDYSNSDVVVSVNGKVIQPAGYDADGNRVYHLKNITAQPVFSVTGLLPNTANSIFEWILKIMRLIAGIIKGWFNRNPEPTTTEPTTEFTTDPEKVYYSASMPPSHEWAYTVTPLNNPYYVLEGSDFKFRVDKAEGAVGNIYVYVDGEIAEPDASGVYTVREVSADFAVAVRAILFSLPAENAAYTFTPAIDPTEVQPGGSFSFTVTKSELVTGNIVVKANGTVINPTSGGAYTISNINNPVKIEVQVVSVTLPASVPGIYAVIPLTSATEIPIGGSFSFRIEKNANYLGNFVIKANGTVINPVGGVYTVTNITGPVTITIGAHLVKLPQIEPNPYYTVQYLTDPSTLGEGGVYRIKITRLGSFNGGISVLANGVSVDPSESDLTIYEIPVNSPVEIDIQACTVLITGLDNPVIRMTAVSDLNNIPVGGSFSFQLELVTGYTGEIVVKANGREIAPNSAGVYTVSNIRGPVTISIAVYFS